MSTITIDDIAVTAREVADTGDWLGRGAALLNDIAARVKIDVLRRLVALAPHEGAIDAVIEALADVVVGITSEDQRLFTLPDTLRRSAIRAKGEAAYIQGVLRMLDSDGERLLDAWDAAVDGVQAAAEGDLDADNYDNLGDCFETIASTWDRVIG